MWNAHSTLTALGSIALAASLAWPSAASGQTGRAAGRGQTRGYDATTETTLRGTVAEVKNVTSRAGGRGMQGMHIVVNAGSETVDVHLGPSWYAKEQNVSLRPGDVVTIVGSRVTIQESKVLIAKRIDKGGTVWTFRDAVGRPLWAGRGRRPQP